jgi:hypothetical protein
MSLSVWVSFRYAFRDYEFCWSLFGGGCDDVRTDVDPLPLMTLLLPGIAIGSALPAVVIGATPYRALAGSCIGHLIALLIAIPVGVGLGILSPVLGVLAGVAAYHPEAV